MSFRNEPNPARAAFLREFAVVGNKVTWGEMPGEIVRTSDSSVWVKLQHPAGTTPTHRFSQRINGEYRMHGKGVYSAALVFDGADAESWRRVSAATNERKALVDLVVEMRKELLEDRTLHMASRTLTRNSDTYLLCLVIPETGGRYIVLHYVTSEDEYEVPFEYATGTEDAVYTIKDDEVVALAAYRIQRALDGYKGPWVG